LWKPAVCRWSILYTVILRCYNVCVLQHQLLQAQCISQRLLIHQWSWHGSHQSQWMGLYGIMTSFMVAEVNDWTWTQMYVRIFQTSVHIVLRVQENVYVSNHVIVWKLCVRFTHFYEQQISVIMKALVFNMGSFCYVTLLYLLSTVWVVKHYYPLWCLLWRFMIIKDWGKDWFVDHLNCVICRLS
jgi:hypothetical protein